MRIKKLESKLCVSGAYYRLWGNCIPIKEHQPGEPGFLQLFLYVNICMCVCVSACVFVCVCVCVCVSITEAINN